MNRSNDEIDRLLARGGLGGPVREEVLDHVLGVSVAPEPRAQRWRLWLPVFALAGAAAVTLVMVVRPSGGDFRAKGGGGGGVPALEAGCLGATLAACPLGSTLVFSAHGPRSSGFLNAYAERPGGERIWYFSAETEAPAIPAGAGTQPASAAVLVGAEHSAGAYTVRVVLSTRPLGRAALLEDRDGAIVARAAFPLTVVAR